MTTVDANGLARVSVTTRRGIDVDVLVSGPDEGTPVVFLHGFIGPLGGEPLVGALGAAGHRVWAPVWPGYSDSATGEEQLTDMLDFALHGADIVEALGLGAARGRPVPNLIGHSMGGMIAAEMAALSPATYGSVVLIAPLGLWLDDHPIIDIYTLLPFEFPPLLFHDATVGGALMAGGRRRDFADNEAIKEFLIDNSRRLGTAGKILFPIPNRRLSKRLYRITNPALLIWGHDDRLLPPPYAEAWATHLPSARQVIIDNAGHMTPYEQTAEVSSAIADFLAAG
jgi:pimeloyl-ACP methyl ester carboxylesterase